MKVEWYDGTGYSVVERCCDDFDKLEYFVSWQPHGLYLEVPDTIEIEIVGGHPIIAHWERLGKLACCPFCGKPIELVNVEVKEE